MFIEKFTKYYNLIKQEFMSLDTRELDAHKQAAIMVISALEAQVVSQNCDADKIPLGPYAVVLDVALSYLCDRINDRLKEIANPIREITLPVAFACDTTYFDIMRRILYYEDTTVDHSGMTYLKSYNIIEWSDRFFLLEYITLQQNHVDPLLMKDSAWDNNGKS